METWPKKACVSTPLLKCYLIINQLRNTPWPRPAVARGLAKVWPHPAWDKHFRHMANREYGSLLRLALYFGDFFG